MTEYNSITSSANDRMVGLMKRALAEGNTTASSVEALMAALRAKDAVMTPGIMVCRVLQQKAPKLLSPALREKDVTAWDEDDIKEAAAVMEKNFGPLCEWKGRNRLGWEAMLKRDLSANVTGSHPEIYKTAICMRLQPEEVTKLFLLNGRKRSPHNLLDTAFLALQERFPDNLSWQMVMDVLREYQKVKKPGNVPYNVLMENEEHQTGTILVRDMLAELKKSEEGEDAFKKTLVEKLAENAECFTSFKLIEKEKEAGCLLAGSVEVTGRAYSVAGARALHTLICVLTVLYGTTLGRINAVKVVPEPYETVDGYPKNLTEFFKSMLSYIGGASKKAEKPLLKYLQKTISGLKNDIDATVKVLDGKLPTSRTLTHADILTLTYFLILGLHRLELEEDTETVRELEHKMKREQDSFAKNFGVVCRTVRKLYCCDTPDQRLSYAKTIYNTVLGAFSEAGMQDAFELYLPLPLDSVLLAAVVCTDAPGDDLSNVEALMDFVDFALHPDALEDAEEMDM